MYKPIKVFIHTPKEGGTAQQGENQKKSEISTHFPQVNLSLGGKSDYLWNFMVVRGDLGTFTSIPGNFFI